MISVTQAKRKLSLSSDSPRETLTTEQSFATAQEELDCLDPQLADMDEINSPSKAVGGWNKKRQAQELQAEAMHFKQTKTLHVQSRHQDEHTSSARSNPHALSGRAARAQLRELRKAGVNPDSIEWAEDDATASKALLELAQGQSNPMAHATLHDEGDSRESSQHDSHHSSSQHDQALAAAWARLHSADIDMGASSPANLAADWRTGAGVAHTVPADRLGPLPQPAEQPLAQPEQEHRASAQPVQSPQASASVPVDPTSHLSEVPSPTSPTRNAAGDATVDSRSPTDAQQKQAKASTQQEQAKSCPAKAQPYSRPVTRAMVRTPTSATRVMPTAIANSKQSTPQSAGKAAAADDAVHESRPEQSDRPALRPVLATLKKAARQAGKSPVSPGQSEREERQQSNTGRAGSHPQSGQQDSPELHAKALKMAMQRLVESEARQRQADEAVLKSTASAQLLQVPVWSASLTPGQSQATARKLQGTLTIPKDCSVRLMRRVFARTIQVQPWCVQMVVTGSNELVQDFEEGREVLVGRYSLQNIAGGLHVQLDLEQGCAQVQALIDQEVALVKPQLLAAHLHTPSTAPAPGPSGQAQTPDRRRSVAAVLESAGWGTTSPAKRVTPPHKDAQAASRHLADYEAMLPAQQQPTRTVPMASPGRRRVGKWDELETDMLIRKMEAGHNWAKMRDEWPSLGCAARSAVDLKDKWRNLEDAVLKGKVMRGTQLTPEQKDRILRCHRKYRSMLASTSDCPTNAQNRSESPGAGPVGPLRQSYDREKSNENAPPPAEN